jgi:hypothetical protein
MSGGPVDLAAVRAVRARLRKLAEQHPELRGGPSDANRGRWERVLEESMGNETNDAQIVVRLPQGLVDRVDAYAERLRDEQPGPAWKRSDVVRMLITRALDQVEKPKGRR